MMMDYNYRRPSTNQLYRHRRKIWNIWLDTDPIPNRTVNTIFYDIPIDIPGITEIENPSPYFDGLSFIHMENVVNDQFQLTLPTYQNFNYYIDSKGFTLTPVTSIEIINNSVVFTTEENHDYSEGTVIDSIENISANSALLEFVGNSNNTTFSVGSVLSDTEFSLIGRNIKIFPNYWAFTYADGENYFHPYTPNYRVPGYAGFVPRFKDPYFVKQNDTMTPSSVFIKEDVNGLPDGRLGFVFATPHSFENDEMIQICFGENLDIPYKKVYVEVIDTLSIVVSEIVVPTTSAFFTRAPRQPFAFTMDQTEEKCYMRSYYDTPANNGFMDDMIPGNRIVFIHNFLDDYIHSNKDWHLLYSTELFPTIGTYYGSFSTRYFWCDITGLAQPQGWASPNDWREPNPFHSLCVLDHKQFMQNSSFIVTQEHDKTMWLTTVDQIGPNADYLTYAPDYWGNLPFTFVQAFKTVSQEYLHIPKVDYPITSFIVINNNISRLTLPEPIGDKLAPFNLEGAYIVLKNVVGSDIISVAIAEVIDEYTLDVSYSYLKHDRSIGSSLLFPNSSWSSQYSSHYMIYEFENEEAIENTRIFPYASPWRLWYYIMDYTGKLRRVEPMIHKDNPLKLICPYSVQDNELNFGVTPLVTTFTVEDFTEWYLGNRSGLSLKKLKKLIAPFEDTNYFIPPHNFVSDTDITQTHTRSDCTYDELTNTLTVSLTQNHDLNNNDIVRLYGISYYTSDFYPRDAFGRDLSIGARNYHLIDYYPAIFNEVSYLGEGTPMLSQYMSNSSGEYFEEITSQDIIEKIAIHYLEKKSFPVTVVSPTQFTVRVDFGDIDLYEYENTIPELTKINLRKNFNTTIAYNKGPDDTVITFDTGMPDGLANNKKYYVRVGSDRPVAGIGEEGTIGSTDLLNLSYFDITDNWNGEYEKPKKEASINKDTAHRMSIETNKLSDKMIHVRILIDGNTLSKTQLLVFDDIIDVSEIPPDWYRMAILNPHIPEFQERITPDLDINFESLPTRDYLALYYDCFLGGLSYHFGTFHLDRKNENDLDIVKAVESWAMLVGDESYISTTIPIDSIDLAVPKETTLSSFNNHGQTLTQYNKSMARTFARFMIDGTEQIRVKKIEVSQGSFNGESIVKVKCMFGNLYNTFGWSQFNVGDWIELGRSRQKDLNRKWVVRESHPTFIVFYTKIPGLVNENTSINVVIVKKLALRDLNSYLPNQFSWERIGGSIESSSYRTTIGEPYEFVLMDSGMTASSTFSYSSVVFNLKRNMKNNFSIFSEIRSNQVDPHNTHWKITGVVLDSLANTTYQTFHFSIAYGRNSLSHHQLLSAGYFRDIITNEWEPMIQGYLSGNYGNPGLNYAFLFSDWTLMDSGHLFCRDHKQGEPTSDAQYIIYRNKNYQNEPSRKDLGFHMYPAPHSPRNIKLIYTPEVE